MLKRIILSVILIFFTIGCEDNIMAPNVEDKFLDVYSTTQLDKNGYYLVNYEVFAQ